jgi:hypothetical protein
MVNDTSLISPTMAAFYVTTRFLFFGIVLWLLVKQTIINVRPVLEESIASKTVSLQGANPGLRLSNE